MEKQKKPAKKLGKRSTKGIRVKDLRATGGLAKKIKGGIITIYQSPSTIKKG